MKNLEAKVAGELTTGAWLIGEFEFDYWAGKIVWFLIRNLGRQTREELVSPTIKVENML